MVPIIRDARRDDCAAITRIYNFYVRTSTCTFDLEEESIAQRQAWFDTRATVHPVLVAETEHRIVGWGALSTFRTRPAYDRTVENSIYVEDSQRGKGVGRALLKALIERGRALGHHSIVAVPSADQPASLALHASFGFVQVAHLREVGCKFDRWIDVLFLQKML